MKYIYPVTALLLCLFSSCDKSSDVPELIKRLPVDRVFKTVILPVKLSETTGLDAYKEKVYIVNSADEFPDSEIIPCDDLEAVDVDFTRQSMIISYQLQLGKIVSAEYRWLYNDWDDHYTLDTTFKKIKDSEYENGAVENLSYLRSALLVARIPSDSRISWSYQVKE